MFFRSGKRTDALKVLLMPGIQPIAFRRKCALLRWDNVNTVLLELTRTLLVEHASGLDSQYKSLEEYDLLDFYWARVAKDYGYKADQASVEELRAMDVPPSHEWIQR
jgi:hypothetical protein